MSRVKPRRKRRPPADDPTHVIGTIARSGSIGTYLRMLGRRDSATVELVYQLAHVLMGLAGDALIDRHPDRYSWHEGRLMRLRRHQGSSRHLH